MHAFGLERAWGVHAISEGYTASPLLGYFAGEENVRMMRF